MTDRRRHTDGPVVKRDYSLAGPDTKKAVEAGFDTAECYWAPVDPDRLQVLMARRNSRPGRFAVTTGEAVRLPAQKPLRTYPVTERDGRLVVCMGESGASLGELHVGSSLKGA